MGAKGAFRTLHSHDSYNRYSNCNKYHDIGDITYITSPEDSVQNACITDVQFSGFDLRPMNPGQQGLRCRRVECGLVVAFAACPERCQIIC